MLRAIVANRYTPEPRMYEKEDMVIVSKQIS